MNICLCGSQQVYSLCCGKYHTDHAIAETPEVLMRSRYAAYAMSNMAYVKATMRGKPLESFDEINALHWSRAVHWLGLKVIHSQYDNLDKSQGYVEFIATYLEDDFVKTIQEISEFHYIDHRWYYVDGKQIHIPSVKISRNSPCPCGSEKKFKHCKHEKSLR